VGGGQPGLPWGHSHTCSTRGDRDDGTVCWSGKGSPIAVILMVSEMTGTLALLASSMVAVVISYYLTGPKHSIYRSQVLSRADSPAHRGEYNKPLMLKLKVSDGANPDVEFLGPDDKVETAFGMMITGKFRGMPIVSPDRKVVGMVTTSDLLSVPPERAASVLLGEIMTKNIISAYPEDTLLDALNKMTTHVISRLPVLSSKTKELVGILTRKNLFEVYNRKIRENLAPDE